VRLGKGGSFTVGGQLAKGGQGAVYDVKGDPNVVFKRVYDGALAKAPEFRDRVQAMVNQPPQTRESRSGHLVLAWPTDLVFDGKRFVGLVMPKLDVGNGVELHIVANPSDREDPGPHAPRWVTHWTWKYLLHTASNLALATQLLHDKGYVIGDFNERNIIVQPDARVTLVDCDSMQVKVPSGRYFLCTVGRPEFTAPELLGVDLHKTPRQPSSDLFALAVHIHQLLLEGLHPFDGFWREEGDKPSRTQLARQGAYVHGRGQRLVAPRHTVPFDVLPRSTRKLFVRAFVDGARDPAQRPTGSEWRKELQALAKRLRTCKAGHDYPRAAGRRCPWCTLDDQRGTHQTALSPPVASAPAPPDPGIRRDRTPSKLGVGVLDKLSSRLDPDPPTPTFRARWGKVAIAACAAALVATSAVGGAAPTSTAVPAGRDPTCPVGVPCAGGVREAAGIRLGSSGLVGGPVFDTLAPPTVVVLKDLDDDALLPVAIASTPAVTGAVYASGHGPGWVVELSDGANRITRFGAFRLGNRAIVNVDRAGAEPWTIGRTTAPVTERESPLSRLPVVVQVLALAAVAVWAFRRVSHRSLKELVSLTVALAVATGLVHLATTQIPVSLGQAFGPETTSPSGGITATVVFAAIAVLGPLLAYRLMARSGVLATPTPNQGGRQPRGDAGRAAIRLAHVAIAVLLVWLLAQLVDVALGTLFLGWPA